MAYSTNPGVTEHLAQLVDFCSEFSNDAGVGVFIDHGVVHDSLGSVGVPQRGQGLLVVVGCG